MTTTILLARHAEVSNPDNIMYGRLKGFRLSANGARQAEDLATYLASERLDAVYVSPMLRAKMTAREVLKWHPNAPLITTKRLHEVATSYQGRRWSEIGQVTFYDPPGDPADETMEAIARRMTAFFRWAIARHPGGTVLAISHGDPIAIAVLAVLGRPLVERELRANRHMYPELASVNRLVFDNAGHLISREYVSPQAQRERLVARV
ncbi:MAG: histidine phosphatase family protein [Dehalococcoidia bacterium]|nr:histidine phosphatase family protein [Dehalococcoidia bacterium]